MLANMSHGAKIAMLGIPSEEMAIDWNMVIFNMLTIKGIYGREMYETWYKMTVMLRVGSGYHAGDYAPASTGANSRRASRRWKPGIRAR